VAAPRRAAAAEAEVADDWRPGDVILGLYEVKQVHEGGGMGLVYRVHHRGWNMDLAVKSPRPEFFRDERDKENFEREAETWVKLGLHPHTVSCYYVRRLGAVPRLFAEYLHGGSLADWLRSGRLYQGTPDEVLVRVLDVAIQFAWGLHAAHEQGLVHQDVKPANVLMTEGGAAKVTDFGLARARGGMAEPAGGDDSGPLVSVGGMTPAYCSPEQARGEPLSRATDVWSYAVSLLEVVLGEVTWAAGPAAPAVLEDYLAGRTGGRLPALPPALADLLRHCLQQAPAARPGDFLAVAAVLRQAYEAATGGPYPRETPEAAEALADTLNNQALSHVDLGKPEEALALWERALAVEGQHPECTYNRGLLRWRRCEITDEALLIELGEVRASRARDWLPACLLAEAHLERGDCSAALDVLPPDSPGASGNAEARALRALAADRLPSSRRPLEVADVGWSRTSADGRYAITSDSDRLGVGGMGIRIWDVASGDMVRSFPVHTTAPVHDMALNGDGRLALTGGNFMEGLKLWETASGRLLREFGLHQDMVVAVALSPDGRRALEASGSVLTLWDADAGQVLLRLEAGGKLMGARVRADWRRALTGGKDRIIRLWDLETGRLVRTLEGHTGGVRHLAFSPDGLRVLSAGDDGALRLWDLEVGRCLCTFAIGPAPLLSQLRFSPDGRSAYASDLLSRAALGWSLDWEWTAPFRLCRVAVTEELLQARRRFVELLERAGQLADDQPAEAARLVAEARALPGFERRPEALEVWASLYARLPRLGFRGGWEVGIFRGHEGWVNCVCFSPDGLLALSGSDDRTLRLWELPGGRCLHVFHGHTNKVASACFSPDGRLALSGGLDRSLKIWEVETGRCLRTFEGHWEPSERRDSYEPGATDAEETGRALMDFADFLTKPLSERLRDAASDKDAVARRLQLQAGHSQLIKSVCLSPDGRLALSGGYDKTLRLWEVATGKCLHVFTGHAKSVKTVCFAPCGRLALSGSEDKTLRLWEVATGKCLHVFTGHADHVRAARRSAHGGLFSGEVWAVGWSADGRLILSGDVTAVLKLWDAGTGNCLATLDDSAGRKLLGGAMPVCLSADGRHALAASGDNFKLWDLAARGCLREFAGHTDGVSALALGADGRYAMSGSEDHTVRLWLLDWELESKAPADWDDGARPYLDAFLGRQTPYPLDIPADASPGSRGVVRALTRSGPPSWTEGDFRGLLRVLGEVGYGWLHPAGVRRELERLAAARTGPVEVPPGEPAGVPPGEPARSGGLRGWLSRLFGRG
jgi:WD40 repeat protein